MIFYITTVSNMRVRKYVEGETLKLELFFWNRDIYWTNWNEQKPSIMKATMSGDNIVEIINSDIRTPNGIVVDPYPAKLYWCDARLDKIERANLDGSNRKVIPWPLKLI